MKAISLTQPWATLVITGEKRIETRSWSTQYSGIVAIHAAKAFPRWAKDLVRGDDAFAASLGAFGYRHAERLPTGAILGTAVIRGCRFTEDVRAQLAGKELKFGDYADDRFAWFLTDAVSFDVAIPCKGALGLWTVPPEVLAQFSKQGVTV